MGKTAVKQKQGRRAPRARSEQGMPDCTVPARSADPVVVCPHCLTSAPASQFMPARFEEPSRFECPVCERQIEVRDFIESAARIREEGARSREIMAPIDHRTAQIERLRQRMPFEFLKKLIARIALAYSKKHEDEFTRSQKAKKDERALSGFESSCYYLSTWFALTGRSLRGESSGADRSWALSAKLVDGTLAVQSASSFSITRGLQAEWLVCQALDRATRTIPELANMQLCTNVFLPNPNANELDRGILGNNSYRHIKGGLGGLRPLYNQIDNLAITQHAVYVIEVKSRVGDIVVERGNVPRQILPDGTRKSLARAVQQCEAHASSFATDYPAIPFERIFELTVFAHCDSLENPRDTFYDNVLVSACGGGREACGLDDPAAAPFIQAIAQQERELAGLEPLFTLDEMRVMATKIRKHNGDINGKKEQLHLERLELLEAARKERWRR